MITPLRLAAVVAAGVAALGCVAAAPHSATSTSTVVPVAARATLTSPAAQSPAAQSPAAQSPAAQSPAAQSPAAESPAGQSPAGQSPAAQSPTWRFDSDDSDSCEYVATPDYVHGDGGGQVIQDDGHAYVGCGDGPIISVDDVDDDSATFSLHGDRVRVREGSTEHLGPYRVHLIDVRGERVEFELSDPD